MRATVRIIGYRRTRATFVFLIRILLYVDITFALWLLLKMDNHREGIVDLISPSIDWRRYDARKALLILKRLDSYDTSQRKKLAFYIARGSRVSASFLRSLGFLKRAFRQEWIGEIHPPYGKLRRVKHSKSVVLQPVAYFGCKPRFKFLRTRYVPETFIAEIRKAKVADRPYAVVSGNTLWCIDQCTWLPYESGNYSEFFINSSYDDDKIYFSSLYEGEVRHFFEEGLLICNRVCNNYFHWMYDCLPRIILADEQNVPEDVPILVRSTMPSQHFQLLEMVNQRNRNLIKCNHNELLEFEKLIVPSIPTFLPDDARLNISKIIIDPDAIVSLRSLFLQVIPTEVEGGELLYVSRSKYSRSTGVRGIVNEEELENMVQSLGGRVIQPEGMDIRSQIEAFASAKVVVLMAGAAAANIIFCRPGAKVVLVSQDANVNPSLFAYIGQVIDVEVILCLGTGRKRRGAQHSHYDVLVDIPILEQSILRALNGDSISSEFVEWER